MRYKYTTKSEEENSANAVGRALPISTKQAVEVCRLIRNKRLQNAKNILKEVISEKKAVPFLRYKSDVGHKKGLIAAGRFPKKTSLEILRLLESVEANAQLKGLSAGNLFINHICAHKASRPWHYGRQRRRKMKRSHVEVIVSEKKEKVVKEEKVEKKEKTENVVKEEVKEKKEAEEPKEEEEKTKLEGRKEVKEKEEVKEKKKEGKKK